MFSLESWIGFILTEVYSVVLLAFIFRRQMREEKQNVWLKTLLVMFALYMGYLFYNLLVPTYFYRRFSFSADRVNLIPFRALKEWLAHPFNFFGNVLLFMPLGFFEVLLYPADSRKRQLAKAAAAGASLSLFVEFAQCFNYRVPDVDDILLNTLGSVLGALLCMLQQKLGFQRTRVGRVLLPAIPRTWRRHMLLNRFCAILVVSMEIVRTTQDVLIITEKGYGKRTNINEFTVQHRGGKGIKCYKIMDKTGYVVGVKAVNDNHEIMMITTEGTIIQIPMKDVSILGRNTSGVKLINLDDKVKVAKIAKVREKVSDGVNETDDEDIQDIVDDDMSVDSPFVIMHDEVDIPDDLDDPDSIEENDEDDV